MINRPQYLNFLISWKDHQLIKVISGIRRCGKSTLLKLYQDYLLSIGIEERQIITINFEDANYLKLRDPTLCYDYITSKMIKGKKNYIFLDEIQHVKDFESVVDSLFIKENADVYITGSNAYFMSSELATLLSGRYIELKMLPLSFKEYFDAINDKSLTKEDIYNRYITSSSFPYSLYLSSKEQVRTYLDGLFNSVVLNDIVQRNHISDVSILKSVLAFMFDNIGCQVSPKKISDTLTSQNRKISNHTVENYLEAIISSLLMYKVSRYDIKGKQKLQLLDKYYLTDIGLRFYLLGSSSIDKGRILENIVYLELLRRNESIYIGKLGDKEVDFIVEDINRDISYYQVAFTVREESTLKRELAPLLSINDHNPKYLLSMDNDPPSTYQGIRQINALDWLLGEE